MPASKADELKTLDNIYQPDPRERFQVNLDLSTFEASERTLEDHHFDIAQYPLDETVPDKIITQYEVARNIYLYAWNAYRFYMVAEHQVLVVLEYAIKQAIGKNKIIRFGQKKGKGSGLAACLSYIFEKQLVCNEDFAVWHHSRRVHAESQLHIDKARVMDEKGLEEIAYDTNDMDIEDYPYDHDYLAILCKSLPFIRNEHAHGSSALHRNTLITFEIVSTIINKLFVAQQSNSLEQLG